MQRRKIYVGIFVVVVALSIILVIEDSFSITGRLGSKYKDCIETDDGDDYNVSGSITYTVRSNVKVYDDYCFARTGKGPEKWLNEYYCNENENLQSRDYNCETYGAGCVNGKCVQEVIVCDDTDGGFDVNVPGKTCSDDECKTDLCLDDIYLSEAYCDEGVKQKIEKCENGCKDGSCLGVVN
tara:strand:+ start:729 stop:1274 length:546 start_codon:yes stop_codon:yes gene_type:complete